MLNWECEFYEDGEKILRKMLVWINFVVFFVRTMNYSQQLQLQPHCLPKVQHFERNNLDYELYQRLVFLMSYFEI